MRGERLLQVLGGQAGRVARGDQQRFQPGQQHQIHGCWIASVDSSEVAGKMERRAGSGGAG